MLRPSRGIAICFRDVCRRRTDSVVELGNEDKTKGKKIFTVITREADNDRTQTGPRKRRIANKSF